MSKESSRRFSEPGIGVRARLCKPSRRIRRLVFCRPGYRSGYRQRSSLTGSARTSRGWGYRVGKSASGAPCPTILCGSCTPFGLTQFHIQKDRGKRLINERSARVQCTTADAVSGAQSASSVRAGPHHGPPWERENTQREGTREKEMKYND